MDSNELAQIIRQEFHNLDLNAIRSGVQQVIESQARCEARVDGLVTRVESLEVAAKSRSEHEAAALKLLEQVRVTDSNTLPADPRAAQLALLQRALSHPAVSPSLLLIILVLWWLLQSKGG
jgi:hypothetical protein